MGMDPLTLSNCQWQCQKGHPLPAGPGACVPRHGKPGVLMNSTQSATCSLLRISTHSCLQDEVDNQRDAIRPLVTLVCNLAKAHSSASTDDAAPANGPKSKLLASCLSALSAYVALCNKLKVLPEHLDEIEEVVLGSLNHSSEHHGTLY